MELYPLCPPHRPKVNFKYGTERKARDERGIITIRQNENDLKTAYSDIIDIEVR